MFNLKTEDIMKRAKQKADKERLERLEKEAQSKWEAAKN